MRGSDLMAGMFDMSVVGLETITDFINVCEKNDAKLLRKATLLGGRVILKAAKSNCDKFKEPTGYLKKSLKMKALNPKEKGQQSVVIGPEVGPKAKYNGWYGFFVENGTSRSEPKAFLRPAFDEKQNEATQKAAEVYAEGWGENIIKDIEDLGDILGGD
jgi:HK97 gp10 family phage protein